MIGSRAVGFVVDVGGQEISVAGEEGGLASLGTAEEDDFVAGHDERERVC